jgi:hypothetical protein
LVVFGRFGWLCIESEFKIIKVFNKKGIQ